MVLKYANTLLFLLFKETDNYDIILSLPEPKNDTQIQDSSIQMSHKISPLFVTPHVFLVQDYINDWGVMVYNREYQKYE